MDFNDLPFVPDATITEAGAESAHEVVVGHVIHPCGYRQPAVEVREQHPGYTASRRFSLSALVHAAMNLTEDEIWAIGGRETDYAGACTPATPLAGVVFQGCNNP